MDLWWDVLFVDGVYALVRILECGVDEGKVVYVEEFQEAGMMCKGG